MAGIDKAFPFILYGVSRTGHTPHEMPSSMQHHLGCVEPTQRHNPLGQVFALLRRHKKAVGEGNGSMLQPCMWASQPHILGPRL